MVRLLRSALAALVLVCIAPLAPLAAQDDDDFDDDDDAEWLDDCRERDRSWGTKSTSRRDRARFCEIRETGMRPGGTLRVEPGQNGGVALRAWDRDSVHIVARIQVHGRRDEDLAAVARGIRVTTSGGVIDADGPGRVGDHRSWSVSFLVFAPRRSNLDLSVDNGPLSVRGISGAMTLSADNGPIALHHVAGDVRARVQNGPLSVVLGGSRWEGAGLDAEARNGPAVLSIPEGYSAKLETGTVNGPMSVDFPLTVTIQGRLTQRLNTTLGDGGAPVRVVTTNGPMVIRRRGRI